MASTAQGVAVNDYNTTPRIIDTNEFVSISVTLTGAVTASGSVQSVPCSASTALAIDMPLLIGRTTATSETVVVTSIADGTHFSAIFTKNHSNGDTVEVRAARQVTTQGDPTNYAAQTQVLNTVPQGTEYGTVVRNIESAQTPGALAPADGTTAKLIVSGTHRVMRLKNTSTQTQPTVVAIYDSATVPGTTATLQSQTIAPAYGTVAPSIVTPAASGLPSTVSTPDSSQAPIASGSQLSFTPSGFTYSASNYSGFQAGLPYYKVDVQNPQGQTVFTDYTQVMWAYQQNLIIKCKLDGTAITTYTPTTTSIAAGVAGPDGNFYYIAGANGAVKFGQCTPTGTITEYALSTASLTAATAGYASGICVTPDGKFLITGIGDNVTYYGYVVQATTSGVFTGVSGNSLGQSYANPAFLPDGTFVAIRGTYQNNATAPILANFAYATGPSLSPITQTTLTSALHINSMGSVIYGLDGNIYVGYGSAVSKFARVAYSPSSGLGTLTENTVGTVYGLANGNDGFIYGSGNAGFFKFIPSTFTSSSTVTTITSDNVQPASTGTSVSGMMALGPDGAMYAVDNSASGVFWKIETTLGVNTPGTGKLTAGGTTGNLQGLAFLNDNRAITYSDANASGGQYSFVLTPSMQSKLNSQTPLRVNVAGSVGYYELPRPTGTRLYAAKLGPSEVIDFANEQVTLGVMVQATPNAVIDGIVVDYI